MLRRELPLVVSVLGLIAGAYLVSSGRGSTSSKNAILGHEHSSSCHAPEGLLDLIQNPEYKQAFQKYSELAKSVPSGSKAPGVACFAEGTPEHVVQAHLQAMIASGKWPSDGLVSNYFISTRWTGAQGTPATITWSLVPDGTMYDGQPSILFQSMDSKFSASGGRATWVGIFQAAFDRYEQLTGIDFVRVTDGTNDWDAGGVAGSTETPADATRGQIRIGGRNYDGLNNVLAYAYYPQFGDMLFDTSENWGSTGNNFSFMRGVTQHEIGHAIGIAHVCPANNTKLMEPFQSSALTGVRHDDARAAQWWYGDKFEPNNESSQAVDLGTLARPSSVNASRNVLDPAYPQVAQDNLTRTAISGDDSDWFKVEIPTTGRFELIVRPVGQAYLNGPQDSFGRCSVGDTFHSSYPAKLTAIFSGPGGAGTLIQATALSEAHPIVRYGNITQPGTYFIKIGSAGASAETVNYELIVNTYSGFPNFMPVVSGPLTATITEGESVDWQFTATNAEANQTVTWSSQGTLVGSSNFTTGGRLTYTSNELAGPGTYYITIIASDTGTPVRRAEYPVYINVLENNTAPIISNGQDQTIDEEKKFTYTFSATDSDLPSQSLTFSLDSGPSGATISPGGSFEWTPTEAQGAGVYPITVRVTDNGPGNLFAVKTITLTVQEINAVPVFNGVQAQTIIEGGEFRFTVLAFDADGPSPLVYSMGSPDLYPGAIFNPDTREFRWKPTTFFTNRIVRFGAFDGLDTGVLEVLLTHTPSTKTIQGKLQVAGHTGDMSKKAWSFDLYEVFGVSGNYLGRRTLTPAADGSFSITIPGLLPGNYRYEIDTSTVVRKKHSFSVSSPNTNLSTITLFGGDGNNDGSIDLLDYFILSDAYGQPSTSTDLSNMPDYNWDGVVDLLDYFVLSDGYGREDE